MRIIRTAIFLVLLFYCVAFCVLNLQTTPVSIPLLLDSRPLPLFIVILISIAFGIILGNLIHMNGSFQKYLKKKGVVKENKTLKKKLDVYEAEQKIQTELTTPSLQESITKK